MTYYRLYISIISTQIVTIHEVANIVPYVIPLLVQRNTHINQHLYLFLVFFLYLRTDNQATTLLDKSKSNIIMPRSLTILS